MEKIIWLTERLALPTSTRAILWDMDGVLIDSIKLDYDICTTLAQRFIDENARITRDLIREGFPLSPPDFWKFLLERARLPYTEQQFETLLAEFELRRRTALYSLNPGIEEVLREGSQRGIRMAVVSNNPTTDVERILESVGLRLWFSVIVGNDHGYLRKKPWPDTYLKAADQLDISIQDCAIIEDSLLGLQAGRRSGGYCVGVSTGGDNFEELSTSGDAHVCYTSLLPNIARLQFGNVLAKSLFTPNDFVSHMIEHVAWRLGASITLSWQNDDWHLLGEELARSILHFEARSDRTAVIGMIDDGSAEVRLRMGMDPSVVLEGVGDVSLEHFLSLRCEQLNGGAPLVKLMEGLARGLGAELVVRVCSLEDPHHTWEGIFRAIGIALSRIFRPAHRLSQHHESAALEASTNETTIHQGAGYLRTVFSSASACCVERESAESAVSVRVECTDTPSCSAKIDVSSTIDVEGFPDLLSAFARSAGLKLEIRFSATKLSSSHVVLEDTGGVLGNALFKIMEERMNQFGINGAGSSLQTVDDFDDAAVAAAVSFEGRKFLKLVPFDIPYAEFRRNIVLGKYVYGSVRSEDVDDFLDALAGGMRASIMVHFRNCSSENAVGLWESALVAVGSAIREAMVANPQRKGLPPGVKATLM